MATKKVYSDGGRKGDESKAIKFGGTERVPSVRVVQDMKETILDKDWSENNSVTPLYYMYRDLARTDAEAKKIKAVNLRFDILDSTAVSLGKEYNKTAGHYHSMVPGTSFSYPEIYELIKGEMYYLMQRIDGNKVLDVYAVRASSGDKVIVPSNYGHFSIFLSSEGVRESNWTCNDSLSDYDRVKQKHGAAYYALIDKTVENGVRWMKNENYSEVPPLRFLGPTNFADLGLLKNTDMYELVNDLEKLDYLVNPQNYSNLWDRVLNTKK